MASEGVFWEEIANVVTAVAGVEDVVVNMVIDVEVILLTSVLVFGVKDVVPDILVDVVAVVVVRVAVMHPVNPDKIIPPHTIPNSHSFFLNIIQSPHRIASSEHHQADSYEDDSSEFFQ